MIAIRVVVKRNFQNKGRMVIVYLDNPEGKALSLDAVAQLLWEFRKTVKRQRLDTGRLHLHITSRALWYESGTNNMDLDQTRRENDCCI